MGFRDVLESIKSFFHYIFFELPRKSFFPLVLLVGLAIAVVLYMILWYILLFRR